MNKTPRAIKLSTLCGVALSLLVFSLPQVSYAAGAKSCCSHHGGVASCDVSGFQLCKDGSVSPSCKCKAKKAVKTKTVKSTADKVDKPVRKSSGWWSESAEKFKQMTSPKKASYPASTTGNKLGGCCSHHGGVAQCNTRTGYATCKDGTASPSCQCQ